MNGDQSLPNDDRGDKAPLDINLQDSALRKRFVSLREQEQQHIPAFASLWDGRNSLQWSKGSWLAAAGCALIVVIAILLLRSQWPNRDAISTVEITEWKAPTDFLLETRDAKFYRPCRKSVNGRATSQRLPPRTGIRKSGKRLCTKGGSLEILQIVVRIVCFGRSRLGAEAGR